MADNIETIEREIEAARDQLAETLDQLSVRANPQRLVEGVKTAVLTKLNQPKVKYPLIGVAATVGGALAFAVVRRIIR